MNVLSLFDGMSCGQIALERVGIKVDNYFASEIDVHAQKVSKHNYPNIIYLGDVRNINLDELPKIDLLIGGSPCQSFSFAGKRKGMSTKCELEITNLEQYLELKSQNFEFEGQSYLFWEYMRVLKTIQKTNPDVKFLLENVIMAENWRNILTIAIGINPIEINSNLVSAQNRRRLYWTNISAEKSGLFGDLECMIEQPKDRGIFLKDILEENVSEDFYLSHKSIEALEEYNKRQILNDRGFSAKFRNEENSAKMDTIKVGGQGKDNLICEPFCVASRGRNPENLTSRESGLHTEQMLEPRSDGKTNTLTSVQKDNYVCEPIGCDYRTDEGFRFRYGGKSGTSLAKESCGQLVALPRIRKLTPVECERLQTVPDNFTAIVSKTQRYKMLGNGWTISVISHIFQGLKK